MKWCTMSCIQFPCKCYENLNTSRIQIIILHCNRFPSSEFPVCTTVSNLMKLCRIYQLLLVYTAVNRSKLITIRIQVRAKKGIDLKDEITF